MLRMKGPELAPACLSRGPSRVRNASPFNLRLQGPGIVLAWKRGGLELEDPCFVQALLLGDLGPTCCLSDPSAPVWQG